MEVRCKKCNKLFRVSDDKITGTGIKFPCTRCGEYVRITREDFEHYTLSRSAEAVPDLIEPKPKPAEAPLWPEAAAAHTEHESPTLNLTAQATRENVSEEKPPCLSNRIILLRHLQRRPNRSLNVSPSPSRRRNRKTNLLLNRSQSRGLSQSRHLLSSRQCRRKNTLVPLLRRFRL